MKQISLLTLFVVSVVCWDNLLFSMVNPNSWNKNVTTKYFTIHGIWPNDANGSWPEYCNISRIPSFNATLLIPIMDSLLVYWTDFSSDPSTFWKHEYEKHASCAMNDPSLIKDEFDYFSLGLQLRTQFNVYRVLSAFGIHPGGTYNTTKITQALCPWTSTLHCLGKQLSEVRFVLTKSGNYIPCFTETPPASNCGEMVFY